MTSPTPELDADTVAALRGARPTLWAGRRGTDATAPSSFPSVAIERARARLQRFAPLLAELFPELRGSGGRIESPLLEAPRMQRCLGLPEDAGALLVKADHALPVAGSIKARGAFHEVLEFVEARAQAHSLLDAEGDCRVLAEAASRAQLAHDEVAVGSTGNLGLAVGVMASALGMRAVVHMSADAKAWKKERLRRRGVDVVEHRGDYAAAVAAGRRDALANPRAHFVDDEHSASLFAGYAAAAAHLAQQLRELGRTVDAQHPLFVYLPCGVGGAPGGIATGLHAEFGANVHCFFAEPVQSPCFMLQMLVDSRQLPGLGEHPSVYDLGLDNRTEADGLAVPRASPLASATVAPFLAGVYTVDDDTLLRHLVDAADSEALRIEPSAAAGFDGPRRVLESPAGRDYLQRQCAQARPGAATHLVWTTGGLFVPDDEYHGFVARGSALRASRHDAR